MSTTSSRNPGSVPGISAITLYELGSSWWKRVVNSTRSSGAWPAAARRASMLYCSAATAMEGMAVVGRILRSKHADCSVPVCTGLERHRCTGALEYRLQLIGGSGAAAPGACRIPGTDSLIRQSGLRATESNETEPAEGVVSTIAPRNCVRHRLDFSSALVPDIDNTSACHGSTKRGRPGIRISNQRHIAGSRHLDGDFFQGPSSRKCERLQPRIGESEFGKAALSPARRLYMCG